ncbi:MAG: YceD family protein [Alphaproteobacteria bacterium]
MTDAPEFSRRFDCNKLGAVDYTIDTEASPEERAALATRLGLLELNELTVNAVIKPRRKGKIRLEGSFSATLKQACVVTLEPVESHIEANFGRFYSDKVKELWQGDEKEPNEEGQGLTEEPPDPLDDGYLDVGEAVAEQLSLEIDPFPRRPDAEFAGGDNDVDDAEERQSPFAVLGKLENKP